MSRTRHTDKQQARILREFEHHDGSAASFCRQRGVSYQTLMNWRGRASANLPDPEQPPAFLEFQYLYHLPFDRQRVLNLQRHGVDLSPNTMGDAAAKVADQCGLLVGRMKQGMLASRYVRAEPSSAISTEPSPAAVPTATSGFTAASPATSSSTGRPVASIGTPASGSDPTTKASFRATATK
jgi:hypothetical protein